MSAEDGRALPSKDNGRSYEGHYHDVGKAAENLVIAFFKSRPSVLGVDDLRDLRPMQRADVDAVIYSRDGTVALVEIKSDYHLGKSGNILFEVLRINHTAPPEKAIVLGWSQRSPAQWLAVYAPQLCQVWIARFYEYRRCFQAFTRDRRESTRVRWINTDNIKSTWAVMVPEIAMPCFTKHNLPPQGRLDFCTANTRIADTGVANAIKANAESEVSE